MSKFFWYSIFRLFEAAFADEDDNVQLIQTRILQKGPVFDLTTSAGQTECLDTLGVGQWASYDCDGTGWKIKAAFPQTCKSNNLVTRHLIATLCCAQSCGTVTTTTTPPTATTTTTTTAEVPDVSVCPGTNSPGGDTDVTDADCLDAERGFGPDFSCANTEMYCSSDSGDGLTVGACCPTKCKQEFEKKKKNSNAEKKGKNEAERKAKRASNEGTRKKNEKERKTKRKDTEWNTKRDAQETKNKNAEEERKNKRGWKEGQRKNERGWKKNRRERRAAADKRERARKETRNKNNKKPISAKACKKNKAKYATCKAKPKCEKKFKKKGRKEPTC